MAKPKEQADIPAPTSDASAKRCQKMADRVDAILLEQCANKVHHLPHCCDCAPDFTGPRIRTHHDAILLNTAYDGSGGIVAQGNQDLHWEVSNSPTGPWSPAIVCSQATAAWSGTLPANSDWISVKANGKPRNGDGDHFYFRLRFVLCDGVDPSKFTLTTSYLVDNTIQEILVNGTAEPGVPAGHFKGDPVSITLRHHWQPCVNEVIFHVLSPHGYIGLAAGFDIEPFPITGHRCDCQCQEARVPGYEPCFQVAWGETREDRITGKGCKTICITACNCYSNLTFEDLMIHQITVLDQDGNPVPKLPDGRPSVEVVPFGPICFGDLGPCRGKGKPNCRSRQVVLRTHGAKPGYYKLRFAGVCYKIAFARILETCFEFEVQ